MRYSNLPAMRAVMVLFLLLGLGATASGSAETGKQYAAITLPEAIARALANNPGIKAARIDVDVEQARRDAGALATPYRFEAEVENFGGTESVSGFDATETTLQLSKVLELGDKRHYRTEIGNARVSLANIEATVRKQELVAEVARRYAAILKRQEQVDLIVESVAMSSRTLDIVRRRVDVGRASEAEQSSAAVALSRIELIGTGLEYELAGLRVGLSTLWGSTNPDFTRVTGKISSLPALPDYAVLEASIVNNPDLRRIATTRQVLNAKQMLAQSKRRSDIEISGGVRHFATNDDMALVFSFRMPFGSGGRAEPLIKEADLRIAKTPMTHDDRLLNLKAALFGFYQALLAMRNEFNTLRDQVIPEAQRAVHFYERGFELGSYSLLELTAAQERLLTLRGEALDAAANFHITLIEIESLLGNISPGGALQ